MAKVWLRELSKNDDAKHAKLNTEVQRKRRSQIDARTWVLGLMHSVRGFAQGLVTKLFLFWNISQAYVRIWT